MFSGFIALARTGFGAVAICGLLSGCAHYEAYQGADAAKVRFTNLGGGDAVGGVFTHVLTIKDGQCSRPALVAHLQKPGTTAVSTNRNTPSAQAAAYPRADMLDSPAPDQANVAEVRLAPGFYVLKFTYHGFNKLCVLAPALHLESGHQYLLDFTERTESGQCHVSGRELVPTGGQPTVQPLNVQGRNPC